METTTKKCRVQIYDPAVTVPPLKFITVGSFNIEEPVADDLGEWCWRLLFHKCHELGHYFKFYSLSRHPDFDYDVTVE